MDLLSACKLAYRKHHLDDDSIGWGELGECLLDALCNEMGDDGFQEWLAKWDQVSCCDAPKLSFGLSNAQWICVNCGASYNDTNER